MSGLGPARRDELAKAVNEWSRPKSSAEFGGDLVQDFLAPLIARWLDEARAEGAAEVRARVKAALVMSDHEPTNRVWHEQMQRIRAALPDPEESDATE